MRRSRNEINSAPVYKGTQLLTPFIDTSTPKIDKAYHSKNELLTNKRELIPDGQKRALTSNDMLMRNDRSAAAAIQSFSEKIAAAANAVASAAAPSQDLDKVFSQSNNDRSSFVSIGIVSLQPVTPNTYYPTRQYKLDNQRLFERNIDVSTRTNPYQFDPSIQFGKTTRNDVIAPQDKQSQLFLQSQNFNTRKNNVNDNVIVDRITDAGYSDAPKELSRPMKTSQQQYVLDISNSTNLNINTNTNNVYGTEDWHSTLSENKHSKNSSTNELKTIDRYAILSTLLPKKPIYSGYQIGIDTTT
jgi:hypothetical protein